MVNENCNICSSAVTDGLRCDRCQEVYHFKRGTGLTNISERTISTYLADRVFSCPLCQVGTNNTLIHAVLTTNQIFNESKHAIPFKLDNQLTESPAPSVEVHDNVKSSTDGSTEEDAGKLTDMSTIVTDQTHPSEKTGNNDTKFKPVLSSSEKRRIGRFKKPLFSLKHIRSSVDTLLILDSNGAGVKGVDIDGTGDNIHVISVGGLCCAATTSALAEFKGKLTQFTRVIYGLGTNDRFHAKEHPGDKTTYIQDLDKETRRVFPKAHIHFIVPFSAIEGLSDSYLRSLSVAILESGVGWKKHLPPSMKGKMTAPDFVHLTQSGRKSFVNWLTKQFAPNSVSRAVQPAQLMPNTISNSPSSVLKRPLVQSVGEPCNIRAADSVCTTSKQAPLAYSGLAREIAGAFTQMMQTWRHDPLHQSHNLNVPPWPPY